jgi:hypothetical protein
MLLTSFPSEILFLIIQNLDINDFPTFFILNKKLNRIRNEYDPLKKFVEQKIRERKEKIELDNKINLILENIKENKYPEDWGIGVEIDENTILGNSAIEEEIKIHNKKSFENTNGDKNIGLLQINICYNNRFIIYLQYPGPTGDYNDQYEIQCELKDIRYFIELFIKQNIRIYDVNYNTIEY